MIERQVEVATPEGAMTTFVYHPEAAGPYPVVLYYMDAPSIRPALKEMASRLATAGYYVMLPFLYYRNSPYREFGQSDEDMHARRELMGAITKAGAITDGRALLAFANDDPAAAAGPAGAVGLCMSGPLVVALAQALPEAIAAAASVHGAWFVTDKPDSTHLNLAGVRAALYFGWADGDPTAPLSDRDILEAAMQAAGVSYTLDFFAGAPHGFAPRGPRYHAYASEKHWERVHALLRRTIG